MSRATPHTLCEQLGRFWAERTTLGLTFAEATATTPANVYASPLPAAAQRLSPGASITPGPGPGPDGLDVTTVRTLVIEAHAPTTREALAMLEDLRALLRPGERPFVDPRTRGVIGAPTLAAGESAAVWQVVAIDLVNEPQPLMTGSGPDVPGGASSDGQAVASWTVAVRAVPATVAYAFGLWQATAAPTVTAATAALDGVTLTLDATPSDQGGSDQAVALAGQTIAQVAAAIDAFGGGSAGWETDNVNGAVSAQAAATLVGFTARGVMGSGNKAHLVAQVA